MSYATSLVNVSRSLRNIWKRHELNQLLYNQQTTLYHLASHFLYKIALHLRISIVDVHLDLDCHQ